MPRQKKRALDEVESNVQPPAKRSSTQSKSDNEPQNVENEANQANETESSNAHDHSHEDLAKKKPEEYICIHRYVSPLGCILMIFMFLPQSIVFRIRIMTAVLSINLHVCYSWALSISDIPWAVQLA